MKFPHADDPETERRFPSDAPSEWMNTMNEEYEHHWHEPKRAFPWAGLSIALLAVMGAGLIAVAVAGAGL